MSATSDFVDIVFDGPPGPEAGRFVEVENASGASIRFGEWVHREDGYWVLRIAHPAPPPAGEAVSMEGAIEAVTDQRFATCMKHLPGECDRRYTCADLDAAAEAIRSLAPIAATGTVALKGRDELFKAIRHAIATADDIEAHELPVNRIIEIAADAILQRGIVRETVPLKGEREIAEAIDQAFVRLPLGSTDDDYARAAARAILANGVAWDVEKARTEMFRQLEKLGIGKSMYGTALIDIAAILKAGSGA